MELRLYRFSRKSNMDVTEISFLAIEVTHYGTVNWVSLGSVFKQLFESRCLPGELSEKHNPVLAGQ